MGKERRPPHERWPLVTRLFHEALERDASERGRFLDDACGGDVELRREVDSLLDADSDVEPGSFIEPPSPQTVGALLAEASGHLADGERVGPWQVEGRVAVGGMGVVYRARRADGAYELLVALKIIGSGVRVPEVLARFRIERQTLARLDHPNIARLVDGGITSRGLPYLAMEFVDGKPIDAYCVISGLDLDARLDLLETVCEAVGYAHRHLVVHRDLKPSNILVTRDGVPKLLDFGLAKLLDVGDASVEAPLTRSGMRLMTPEYASPEQIRGEPVTTATDVHALGVLLYETLTGRHPFVRDGRSISEVERAVSEETPPRPSAVDRRLAGDLETIVRVAMHKEPSRRYASAERLAEDLRRFRGNLPILARKDTLRYRAAKFVRRNRLLSALIVVAALAVAVGTAGVAWWAWIAGNETARAESALVGERRRARSLENVNGFLERLLGAADPRRHGRDALVRDLLEAATETIDADPVDDPEVEADVRSTLGKTWFGIGMYAEAAAQQSKVLSLVEARRPEEPLALALAHRLLAESLLRSGAYVEARDHFDRALEILTLRLPDEAFERSLVLGSLGSVLMLLGNRERAEAVQRDAVRLSSTARDANGIDHALLLDRLSKTLVSAGRKLDEAESLQRTVLDICASRLPADHPSVLDSRSQLALILIDRGKYPAARDELSIVAAAQRERLGPDHADLGATLALLGRARFLCGDAGSAETTFREAVAIQRSRLGESHPAIVQTLSGLGAALRFQGKLGLAREAYEQALELRRSRFGDRDSSTATSLHNLAIVQFQMGDYDVAKANLEAALATQIELQGRDHSDVAQTLNSLGFLYRAKGEHSLARDYLRRGLATWRHCLPPTHPQIASSLFSNAATEQALGNTTEAIPLLRECREIQTKQGDAPREFVAKAASLLGACLTELGEYAEAEQILVESASSLEAEVGMMNPLTRTALERLLALYDEWGQTDRAHDVRRRLAE